MSEIRKPRVGDDVLYVSYGTPDGEYGRDCRAAKVTAVGAWITVDCTYPRPGQDPNRPADGDHRLTGQRWKADAVTLFVMNPGGLFLNPEKPVEYHTGRDEAGEFVGWLGGTWHWPCDEPDVG